MNINNTDNFTDTSTVFPSPNSALNLRKRKLFFVCCGIDKATRQDISQFQSLEIRRSTFLSKFKSVDRRVLRIWNCESLRRVMREINSSQCVENTLDLSTEIICLLGNYFISVRTVWIEREKFSFFVSDIFAQTNLSIYTLHSSILSLFKRTHKMQVQRIDAYE